MSEVVCAFLWSEGVEDFSNAVPEVVPGSFCGFAQQGLEFGEGHLDGVEVWRVWRQVEQGCVSGLDQGADTLKLVGWQVIHHHDVARRKGWNQHLFDIGQEGLAILCMAVTNQANGSSALC